MARSQFDTSSSSSSSSSSSASYSTDTSSTQGNAGQAIISEHYDRLVELANTYGGTDGNRTDKWKLMENLYDWDVTRFPWKLIEGKGVEGKKVRQKPRYYLHASSSDWAATPEQFKRAAEFIFNGTKQRFVRDKEAARILAELLAAQFRLATANIADNIRDRQKTIEDINDYKHNKKYSKTMSQLSLPPDYKRDRYGNRVKDKHGNPVEGDGIGRDKDGDYGAYSQRTSTGRTFAQMNAFSSALEIERPKVWGAIAELRKI